MASETNEPKRQILVVDDDEAHNEGVMWRLRRDGFDAEIANRAAECIAAIENQKFDVVLLDYHLGSESGIDVLRAIRNVKGANELPVIMVTAESASETTVTALRYGANDYITKPVDLDVMVQRIRTQLSLRAATHELERRALYDQLTGLPNRALLEDRCELAFSRCTRGNEMLAVLFLDLDDFKRVNDVYGHAAGDAVLKSVAQRISAAARKSDTISRLGGDEFVVVMERIQGLRDLELIASRIQTAVAQPIDVEGSHVKVGVSIGSYLWRPGDAVDLSTIIKLADRAMYGQKRKRKAS